MSTNTEKTAEPEVNSIVWLGFHHQTTHKMMTELFERLEERANNPDEYIEASVLDAKLDLSLFKAAGFYKPNVCDESRNTKLN